MKIKLSNKEIKAILWAVSSYMKVLKNNTYSTYDINDYTELEDIEGKLSMLLDLKGVKH